MRHLQLVASFFATILTTIVAFAAGSREVGIGAPAAWVENLAVPGDHAVAKSAVNRHYLLLETQRNVAHDATYHRQTYRLLTESGVGGGSQVSVSFDPAYETITLHRLQIIRDGQVLERLDPARIRVIQRETDLDDALYRGELTALMFVDDVRVGDVIDFAYTSVGSNPVFGGRVIGTLPLEWGVPISHLKHRLLLPPGRLVNYRIIGPTAIEASERRLSDDSQEIVWEARGVPAVTYDNRIPAWYPSYALVVVSEFQSWRAVVEWALPLYANDERSAGALGAKAEEIRSAASSPAERALAALRFVQEDIRYLGLEDGDASHRPSSPGDVLSRRYGDCKDKARLLVTLLQALEIDAHPVLVHSQRGRTLLDWLATPYAFDHVIVRITLEDETYVVDPTLLYQRGSLRHRHTGRYRVGLPIAENATELETWADADSDRSETRVDEVFGVTALDAPAELLVRSTYSGRAAEQIRAYLASSTREEIGKAYSNFYAKYYPHIVATQPVDWSDEREANTVVVEERYSIPHLFQKPDDSAVWKAEFYPTSLNDSVGSPGAGGRTAPLAIAHPVDITHRTLIRLMEDWSVNPETVEVADPAFAFSRESKGGGKEVEWVYRWSSRADHVAPERFSDYSRAMAKVNARLGTQLTYDTAAAAEPGFVINGWMIALMCIIAGATIWAGVWLWRRPAPVRPATEPPLLPDRLEGIGGWLILVAFGVIARPLILIASVQASMSAYFNLTVWRVSTDPASAAYQPAIWFILPVELTLNTLMIVGSIVMVPLFFGRKRAFPAVMIGFLALALATSGFQLWTTHALNSEATDIATAVQDLIRALGGAVIWIPYFVVSRRVKQTFTR